MMQPQPKQPETLRGQLGLSANQVYALLVDSDGVIVGMETAITNNFSAVLSRFRAKIDAH